MKHILSIIFSIIITTTLGCVRHHKSTNDIDPMAQYRDTIVGCFNGVDIDTLICELTDTLPISYRHKIISQKNSVLPLSIENAQIPMQLENEGDLDGNGTDEIGFIHYQNGAGCWGNYIVLTYQKGWKVLYHPYIHSLWLGLTDVSFETVDLVQPIDSAGLIKIRYFDIEKVVTPCSINDMREDTISVDPQWLSNFRNLL